MPAGRSVPDCRRCRTASRPTWKCTVLQRCSVAGEGCLNTGCCKDPSLTCYVKNEHWADCRKSCEPGKVDPKSPKHLQSPWSCAPRCSVAGQGCLATGCCQKSGLQCFRKNEEWAD